MPLQRPPKKWQMSVGASKLGNIRELGQVRIRHQQQGLGLGRQQRVSTHHQTLSTRPCSHER
jgi:hypothetical protein